MKLTHILALSVASALLAFTVHAETPKVGDRAPMIEGKDQTGASWKLADLLGQKHVLLYFYPKDQTPGCTKQACGLRDQMADLQKSGVAVVGVSRDDSKSHQQFVEKHQLNFTLVADVDGKITEKYGAAMAGKPLSRRISFLINKDGHIVHVTDDAKADTHLDEVKKAVAHLK